jgi:hypothetical protein
MMRNQKMLFTMIFYCIIMITKIVKNMITHYVSQKL